VTSGNCRGDRQPWNSLPLRKLNFAFLAEATMRAIILIIVILLLVGALPTWPYSSGWGYYPSSGLGLVLIIVLILVAVGRF
jgi:hypothetical protein